MIFQCPKCGKPMQEQVKFRGLWVCPDGITALNLTAPFEYLCTGMVLTNEGAQAFENELSRLHLDKIQRSN